VRQRVARPVTAEAIAETKVFSIGWMAFHINTGIEKFFNGPGVCHLRTHKPRARHAQFGRDDVELCSLWNSCISCCACAVLPCLR
jgi:hypothetical protein